MTINKENIKGSSVLKYYRFEGSKIILLPSEDGLKVIQQLNPTFRSQNNPRGLSLSLGEESVGKNKVISLIADFGANIIHVQCEQNVVLNKIDFRVFTSGSQNFYLTLPFVKPLDSSF
jgi:hypothetical protein